MKEEDLHVILSFFGLARVLLGLCILCCLPIAMLLQKSWIKATFSEFNVLASRISDLELLRNDVLPLSQLTA